MRTRSWGGREGNDVLNGLCPMEETEKGSEWIWFRSGPCYSDCDLMTEHISIPWELPRDAGSQMPPRPMEADSAFYQDSRVTHTHINV